MTFSRTWLLLLSFVTSLVLWLAVQTGSKPGEKVFECQIQVMGLRPGLVALNLDDLSTIQMTAHGPQEYLDRLRDPLAYVDASRLTTGKTICSVVVEGLKRYEAQGITWTSVKVPVVVDVVVRRKRPVKVTLIGSLPFMNYIYDGAQTVIDPEQVEIVGPSTRSDQIREARVTLDLSTVQRYQTKTLDVELVDENGAKPEDFRTEPPTVAITPGLVPAPQNKLVLVEPQFGPQQPAFGYEVEGTEVQPHTIRITGPSEALAATTTVLTKPISLAGLKDDSTVEVQLDLPRGIHAERAGSVRVTVHIRRSAQTSQPAAVGAPDSANPAP